MLLTDYIPLTGKEKPTDATVLEIAEHRRVGDDSTGRGYKLVGDVAVAQIVTISGTNIYVAVAKPGSSSSDSVWQCKKIDTSSGVITTWADGNDYFDNSATDLTALTYL